LGAAGQRIRLRRQLLPVVEPAAVLVRGGEAAARHVLRPLGDLVQQLLDDLLVLGGRAHLERRDEVGVLLALDGLGEHLRAQRLLEGVVIHRGGVGRRRGGGCRVGRCGGHRLRRVARGRRRGRRGRRRRRRGAGALRRRRRALAAAGGGERQDGND